MKLLRPEKLAYFFAERVARQRTRRDDRVFFKVERSDFLFDDFDIPEDEQLVIPERPQTEAS